MAKIRREVNLKNLVRELAHNKVDALELVREALSNARDHHAKRVWIRSVRGPAPALATDLFVMNDGEGMTDAQLRAFWGVSSSVKGDPTRAIGYKGHGSKLFFSCRRLSVATRREKSERWQLTTLDDPLDSDLAEVEPTLLPKGHRLLAEISEQKLDSGVAILVEGCQFHDATRFMARQEIESYCDWFTVVGDVRSGLFRKREDFHDVVAKQDDLTQLRVTERDLVALDVYLRMNGEDVYLPIGAGKKRPESEHLDPWRTDATRWLASNTPGMAAFGHRFADHFESDASAGARRVRDDRTALCLVGAEEFSRDPQFGMVMRVEGQRRQLDAYPEASRQPRGGIYDFDQRFGLWLCKDFVPVVQRNDLLGKALGRATEKARKRLRFDLGKTRFWQVFVNHQDFLLTANRNDIANASHHAERIVELVAGRVAEALKEDAFREWVENLQRAVTSAKRSREVDAMDERRDAVTQWFRKGGKHDVEPIAATLERLDEEDSLRLPAPTNEQELFYLYAILAGRFQVPLRVIEYQTRLGIDAIAQVIDRAMFDGKAPSYARVEFKFALQGNRAIGHYFDAIDAIVCWSVTSTGPLPEAGDDAVTGILRKRRAPRLTSKLDTHEVEYTTDKGDVRVLPVLALQALFPRPRSGT